MRKDEKYDFTFTRKELAAIKSALEFFLSERYHGLGWDWECECARLLKSLPQEKKDVQNYGYILPLPELVGAGNAIYCWLQALERIGVTPEKDEYAETLRKLLCRFGAIEGAWFWISKEELYTGVYTP